MDFWHRGTALEELRGAVIGELLSFFRGLKEDGFALERLTNKR